MGEELEGEIRQGMMPQWAGSSNSDELAKLSSQTVAVLTIAEDGL